jgi:hypothetical protein
LGGGTSRRQAAGNGQQNKNEKPVELTGFFAFLPTAPAACCLPPVACRLFLYFFVSVVVVVLPDGVTVVAVVVSVLGAGAGVTVVVVAVVVSAGFTSTLVLGAGVTSVLVQPTTPKARRAATR